MEPACLRSISATLSVFALLWVSTAGGAEEEQQRSGRDLWSQAQEPVHFHSNTYYVGTRGLSAVLITSDAGHVLIDGGLAGTVPQILANVRKLGLETTDIEYILNSHAHFDHAGGIAELQKVTGAKVISSASGADALERGMGGPDDPQYTLRGTFPAVAEVEVLEDGGTLALGELALTVHYTPGHTPGGTSWTWQSCERDRCLNFVYADSLNAVSSDDFRYSGDHRYPNAADDLKKSISRIAQLPCDILISAHPEGSDLWLRIEKRRAGDPDALIAKDACREYADVGRKRLEDRLANERTVDGAAR